MIVPYFFYHYKINKNNLSLVQNVLSDEKKFNNNLFHALVVSRIWILYQFNCGSIEDFTSIPDLKWDTDDLKREIDQSEDMDNIFAKYNVVVYSPSGELLNNTETTPQAYLIQYKSEAYAALLFVSLSERGRKNEALPIQPRPPKAVEDDNFPREMERDFSPSSNPSFSPLSLQPAERRKSV